MSGESQQQPTPLAVQSALHSDNWVNRASAMLNLAQIDSPASRNALIELLVSETKVANAAYLKYGGTDPAYGESYGEYLGQLQDLVIRLADNPSYPAAIHALAGSACEPDSQFARWLAQHGDTVVPDLIQLSKSDADVDRACGAGVLGVMLKQNQEHTLVLKPANRSIAKAIVVNGLKDKSVLVKYASLDGLVKAGDATDLISLKDFAAKNKESNQLDEDGLKDKANKAIGSIQERQVVPVARQ